MRLALPLVGTRQPPSQGVQGEFESEILRTEGTSPQSFEVAAMPDMISKGELRAMVTPVQNFHLVDVFEDSTKSSGQAAEVTFTLYRGSYATVVLRELIKTNRPIKAGF
jgi:tRNA(Glu) U13 pseudouridine synthase TruD